MDPNLLPQELREKELQERQKAVKTPKTFDIYLTNPEKDKLRPGFYSDKPKTSWWRKIFGEKQPKNYSTQLTNPIPFKENKNKKIINDSNLLKADSPKLRTVKVKKGFWRNLLGSPVSPLADSGFNRLAVNGEKVGINEKKYIFREKIRRENVKVEAPQLPSRDIFSSPEKRVKISANIEKFAKPIKGDSWWAIFSGMFKGLKRRKVEFKFAQDASVKSADLKPIEKPRLAVKEAEPVARPVEKISLLKKEIKKPESTPKPVEKKESVKTVSRGGLSQPKVFEKSDFLVNLAPKAPGKEPDNSLAFEFWLMMATSLFAIFLLVGVYGILLYLNNGLTEKIASQQKEFSALDNNLKELIANEKKNNQLADKINAIKKLFDNQIKWSRFFSLMEKYTLNGVYFTQLVADTSGSLVLPGVAEDYSVLARQLVLLRDAEEFIKEVKLSNAQIRSDDRAGVVGVAFQIRLMLQDSIFKKL